MLIIGGMGGGAVFWRIESFSFSILKENIRPRDRGFLVYICNMPTKWVTC